MDALHTQLSMINILFDIIGIIYETNHQINKDFLVNVDMQGYSMYTRPSKSSCGGCAIYVNSQLDHLEMTFQHWKRSMKHYGLR